MARRRKTYFPGSRRRPRASLPALLAALVIAAAVWYFQGRESPQDPGAFLVERVVDGDTFVLAGGDRVRLIGVDTPETKHPSRPVEHFGREAGEFTRRMLQGKRVRLEYDVQPHDRYGRILAYVYLEDGTFFNAELVRQGYARAATYPPNVKHADEFVRLEREAREADRGLWAEGEE
ncbi:MAG: nuclease [Candidatus Zixiibacteriota bacterium]|nr:MAG: nuclease [candidate division Zixibacteria bacterium]